MKGTIRKLNLDRGFGFIKPVEGFGSYFFHVNDLRDIPFDDRAQEMFVEFDVSKNDSRGPRAVNVRKAD